MYIQTYICIGMHACLRERKQIFFYHFTYKTPFYFISKGNGKIKKIVKVTKAIQNVVYYAHYLCTLYANCMRSTRPLG